MKFIGSIQPEYTDDGEMLNKEYVNGGIVMLTSQETQIIARLQEVCDGEVLRFYNRYDNIKTEDMSVIFSAIMAFIKAKLAVNELRQVVKDLDDMLMDRKNNETL